MLDITYRKNMSKKTTYHVKKLVSLTEEQASRIADYRFTARIPSENEAIRQLIEIGLKAIEKADDKPD